MVVFFDFRANHSFIYVTFVKLCDLEVELLEYNLFVATPTRNSVVCRKVFRECPIVKERRVLLARLVVFSTHEFNVILRMDWLATNYSSVDCFNKDVAFKPPREQ